MTILWLVSLMVGLMISVLVMISGVASSTEGADAKLQPPRIRAWLPMLAAFCAVAGAVGYGLIQLGHGASALASAVAVGAALIAAVVVGGLVRWSSSAAHQDSNDDPRFRFQGHVARVVEAIAGDRPGRITFEVDSRHYDLRATAIDGGQVAAGTEVVIEHIADDLATVDLWSRIEDRL